MLKVHCEFFCIILFSVECCNIKIQYNKFYSEKRQLFSNHHGLGFPRSRCLSCRCHVETPRNVVLLCSVFIFWRGLLGPSCNGMSGICFCTASPHQYATMELNMTKFTTVVYFYYMACCGVTCYP